MFSGENAQPNANKQTTQNHLGKKINCNLKYMLTFQLTSRNIRAQQKNTINQQNNGVWNGIQCMDAEACTLLVLVFVIERATNSHNLTKIFEHKACVCLCAIRLYSFALFLQYGSYTKYYMIRSASGTPMLSIN